MPITKNDPQSEFWKGAEEASRRVKDFPPWKLGILEPVVPVAKEAPPTALPAQTEAASTPSATHTK